MRPVYVTEVLAAADPDGIAVSQMPVGAGNLTINGALAAGGVATLDTARVVGITSDDVDSGVTFTVYGTDANGNAMNETVTGPSTATVSTVLNFKTVTRVAISGAATGNITVGTTGVGASAWIPLDYIQTPFAVGFGCVVIGTVNYTVQHTFDDVFNPLVFPVAFNHEFVVAQSTNQDGNYAFPVRAVRVQVNSGTAPVAFTVLQGLGG